MATTLSTLKVPDSKVSKNQPIRDILLNMASTTNEPYTRLMYTIAAAKVADVGLDLFMDSKETTAWLSTLGGRLQGFISEFSEIYSLMLKYNTTGDLNLFFPPEWRGTLTEDDDRYSIALELDVNSFHSKFTPPSERKVIGEALNFYYGTIKYEKTRAWLFEHIERIACGSILMQMKHSED